MGRSNADLLELDVATGTSRTQVRWRNGKMTWGELADRLSRTQRTSETRAEYEAMPKAEKAAQKDVGGFVGGYLEGGRRSHVRHRQVLTLDADYESAGSDLAEDFAMVMESACCTYGTHTSTPDAPRRRLVAPLSRPCSPDEYQALARMVAYKLGMTRFDHTTFQAQRLMYWPSTPQDMAYEYEREDGPALDVDAVLGEYVDWTDSTSWPGVVATDTENGRRVERKADPRERPGLVGAFNRAHPIEEAIGEFVPDYEPCEGMEGRYTYANGTTAGGVVTYEGVWSYSHHDTDPASNRLLSAFDLVRVHRFGDLDEDSPEGTPESKLPSTAAMLDLAAKDAATCDVLNGEGAADFDVDDGADPDEADRAELRRLARDKRGCVLANYANIEIIMDHDPAFKGLFGFDDFDRRIHVMRREVFGRRVNSMDDTLRDQDEVQARAYLDKRYGIRGKDLVHDAIELAAARNRYHSVRDYLDGLEWDGVNRLDSMLADWLGCEDTAYTREVTRRVMAAAVGRIYDPACKWDNMLVVKGDQGIGKSTIWAKLGGKWFSDTVLNMENKEAMDAIQGVWIVEVPELAGMSKARTEQVKGFLSKSVDRYRRSYGRNTETYVRQCIFVGTTNEGTFLRDATGNRRFWIVEHKKGTRGDRSPFDMTRQDVDALWAEAKHVYEAEGVRELSPEADLVAKEKQAAFNEEDPRRGEIQDYLDAPIPEGFYDMDPDARRDWVVGGCQGGSVRREHISNQEVMYELYGKRTGTYDQRESRAIGVIVGSLEGWDDKARGVRVPGYGVVKSRFRLGGAAR